MSTTKILDTLMDVEIFNSYYPNRPFPAAIGDTVLMVDWERATRPRPGAVFYSIDKPLPKGRKDDSGKPAYELIAPEMLEGVAEILTFGAKKYEERNWEKGMKWGRVFGALMRHLWAWWRGENNDSETGKSHLWHAACCIMFLIAYEQRGVGEDDRYVSNKS